MVNEVLSKLIFLVQTLGWFAERFLRNPQHTTHDTAFKNRMNGRKVGLQSSKENATCYVVLRSLTDRIRSWTH
jgi:hypothetical protein